MFKDKDDFIVRKTERFEVELDKNQKDILENYIVLFNSIKEILIRDFLNRTFTKPEKIMKEMYIRSDRYKFDPKIYQAILVHCINKLKTEDLSEIKRFKKAVIKTMKMTDIKAEKEFITTNIMGAVFIHPKHIKRYQFALDNAISVDNIVLIPEYAGKFYFIEMTYYTNEYKDFVAEFPNNDGIGIDVGVDIYLALSDGTTYRNPVQTKFISKMMADGYGMNKENFHMNYNYELVGKEKQETFKRRKKLNDRRIAKTEYKITSFINMKIQEYVFKICAKRPAFIVTENLNNFTRDYGKFCIRVLNVKYFVKILKRTCEDLGIPIFTLPGDTNTSKVCSECGGTDNYFVGRVFHCNECGFEENRDLNAAKNIRKFGEDLYNECKTLPKYA